MCNIYKTFFLLVLLNFRGVNSAIDYYDSLYPNFSLYRVDRVKLALRFEIRGQKMTELYSLQPKVSAFCYKILDS